MAETFPTKQNQLNVDDSQKNPLPAVFQPAPSPFTPTKTTTPYLPGQGFSSNNPALNTGGSSSSSSTPTKSTGTPGSVGGNPFIPAPSPFTSSGNVGGTSDKTIVNPQSPTGYTDTLNQPISVPTQGSIGQSNKTAIAPYTDSLGQGVSKPGNLPEVFQRPTTALSPVLPLEPKTYKINQPNEINISTDYGFVKPYSQPFLTGVSQSASIIGRDILSPLTGETLENPLSPFGYSGTNFRPSAVINPIINIATGFNTNLPYDVFPSKSSAEMGIEIVSKGTRDSLGQEMSVGENILGPRYGEQTFGLTTTGKAFETVVPIALEVGALSAGTLLGGAGLVGPALATDITGLAAFGIGTKGLANPSSTQFEQTVSAGLLVSEPLVEASGMFGKYGELNKLKVEREASTMPTFSFSNPLKESRISGEAFDISKIKGSAKVKDIEYGLNIEPGKILKSDNSFIQPGSTYEIFGKGTGKGYINSGEFAVEFYQSGQIGTKGISIGGLNDLGSLQSFFGKQAIATTEDFSLTATAGYGTVTKEFESFALTPLKGDYDKALKTQLIENARSFEPNEIYTKQGFFGLTGKAGEDIFGNELLVTKSGKIKSVEYIPEKTNYEVSKVFTSDIEKTFHGTSSTNTNKIFEEGLKPGKFGEVFTTSDKGFAEGFGAKGAFDKRGNLISSKVDVLEIVMPKNIFAKSAIQREGLAGTSKEFAFKEIEPRFIKGSETFGEGFTKTITKKITTPEDFRIDANIKDITYTKLYKVPKFETTIDFSNTKSGLGYSQILKNQKSYTDTSFIQKGTINELSNQLSLKSLNRFDTGIKGLSNVKSLTNLNLKNDKFNSQINSLGSLTKTRTKEAFSSNLGLDLSSISKSKTKTYSPSFSGSKTMLDIKTNQKSYTPSIPNLELGLTQISKSSSKLASPNIGLGNFNLGGNFGGFNGGIGLPSLGSGLGYSPRKPKKNKRIKTKIAPSFTASVFDIKTGLPKEGKLGISPFSIRGLPKNSRSFNIGI